MYKFHRYNLIRYDISSPSIAYKLFVRSLYDYAIVKEETSSGVTTRGYFVAAKGLETSWNNRASLTYSSDIKGRKLVNEGQDWLLAAIGRITELKAGVNYKVEDYPLNWIAGTYYSTYKGNTFQVSSIENVKSEAEYDAVTLISLINQSLTTDFTGTLLGKFNNLSRLRCYNNQISVLDVSQLVSLTSELHCANNQISVLDVSQLVNLRYLDCSNNDISILDVTNLVNLDFLFCQDNNITVLNTTNLVNVNAVYCYNNNITTLDASGLISCTNLRCYNNQLDAATNSQILIDLDTNGLSNGYFQSTIFGGGTLTAAGQTAKANLQAKGWNIIGV